MKTTGGVNKRELHILWGTADLPNSTSTAWMLAAIWLLCFQFTDTPITQQDQRVALVEVTESLLQLFISSGSPWIRSSAAKRKHLPFQWCYLVCVSRPRRVSQEQKQGFGWELHMVICVKKVIVEEEKEHPGGKPIPCMFGVTSSNEEIRRDGWRSARETFGSQGWSGSEDKEASVLCSI